MTDFWIIFVFLCSIFCSCHAALAPVISDVPTSVSVGEVETTSRLIYTINANDPDGDPILCDVQSLVPADGYFVVTKSTETGNYGVYTSSPTFNFSVTPAHTVNMQCSDSGGLQSTVGLLSVDVIEGDELKFKNLPASKNKDASTVKQDDTIYTVTSEDLLGRPRTYSMTTSPVTSEFYIDQGTGAVKATRDLIYEVYSTVVLYVTVTDGRISVVEKFTINLNNVNTFPIFTNLVENSVTPISFPENSAYRTVLYTLAVYDPDNGQTQTVTFNTNPPAKASTFNLTNNVLSLAFPNRFDYEDHQVYTLEFYVTDSYKKTGPYYLQITVLQEAENCSFDKSEYEASPDEGPIDAGTTNLKFTITDEDNPDSHTYTVLPGPYAHLFKAGVTSGVITFAVNYDVDTGSSHPSNLSIVIQCTDTFGKTGTATVSIYVQDINDNPPDFSAAGYVVYSNQYLEPGNVVGTITATDRDSGNNAEIEYTATSATGIPYYHIAKNGKIILLTDLPFDYGTTHRFHVTAVDKGIPPLTGTTYVDIVYRETTTTSTTTPTTTLAPADFWTAENIALIAALAALLLIGLGVLLCLLLRNRGCCSGVNGPRSCRDSCRCPKRSPNRVVVTPKDPKAGEWKLWDNKLEIKDTTDSPSSASYLDLNRSYDNNGHLSTKIYDKHELNIQRQPYVTNVTEASIPQTMRM